MVSPAAGLPVPTHLQRRGYKPPAEWLGSGLFLVDLLRRRTGRQDLSEVELLDVGCGTLLVKTLLDNGLPVARYTGVDVSKELVAWLRANVSDPRFEFHAMDARNAFCNPGGRPLAGFDLLPVEPQGFDLICAFSAFIHLPPDDFVTMLKLLRRHVKPDGTLLFSLFLLDSEHPPALAEQIRKRLNSDDPAIRAETEASLDRALRQAAGAAHDPRFVDADPDRPLAQARYTRDYAIELFEGTGWEIDAIHPPERHIRHCAVCRPV
jgi:SAM-dependent methyltransferase